MRTTATFRTLLIMLSACLAGLAAAQQPPAEPRCQGHDAVAGVNWGIADDGAGNVYVAGDGGVLRSCNGANSWTKSSSPPSLAVLVDPEDSSIIYSGTDRGVYVSRDYGQTWEQTGVEMGGLVMSLAAQADGAILAGAESGIYRSVDEGVSWARLASGPSNVTIRALLAHPGDLNVIYAGTNGEGLYRSLDNGVTWRNTGNGNADWQINDLDFDPANPSVILAASWDELWHSSDGGTSWMNIGGTRLMDLAFHPDKPSVVYRASFYGGVSRSIDSGWHWQSTSGGISQVRNKIYSVHVLPGGRVLIGTEFEGMFMSDDAGQSWVRSGDEPATQPPSGGNPPASGNATLRISTQYLYEDGVPAGSDAPFRITITNDGPDPSIETRVTFSWSHQPLYGSRHYYDYTVRPGKGSCERTARPDCVIGTIANGETVTLDFWGATAPGKLAYYDLRVTASNAQGYSRTATDGIGSSVTVFDSDSGGAGSGGPLILLLLAVASLSSARPRSSR